MLLALTRKDTAALFQACLLSPERLPADTFMSTHSQPTRVMAEVLCQLPAMRKKRGRAKLADTSARCRSPMSLPAYFSCSEMPALCNAAEVSPWGALHQPQGSQGKHGSRTA